MHQNKLLIFHFVVVFEADGAADGGVSLTIHFLFTLYLFFLLDFKVEKIHIWEC